MSARVGILKCACLAVLALGHVEHNSVSVQLRRGVAFNWASGIVFKRRRDELAGRLRCVDVADASLCVAFQPMEQARSDHKPDR